MHNDLLNGPQTLHVILSSFEYDDGLGDGRTVQDLCALEWMGDSVQQKTLFYNTFLDLARNMKNACMAEEGLRDILAVQIKKSKDLEWEFKEYERSEPNAKKKTLQFLLDALMRSITRDNAEIAKAEKEKEMKLFVSGKYDKHLLTTKGTYSFSVTSGRS